MILANDPIFVSIVYKLQLKIQDMLFYRTFCVITCFTHHYCVYLFALIYQLQSSTTFLGHNFSKPQKVNTISNNTFYLQYFNFQQYVPIFDSLHKRKIPQML